MNKAFFYLIPVLAAAGGTALSVAMTLFFRRMAVKWDVMDRPKTEDHKKHGRAVALLGGAAIGSAWLAGVAAGVAAMLTLSERFPELAPLLEGISRARTELVFVSLGALLSVFLGLYDDIHSMKAHWKFFGQFVIAAITVSWGGARISVFVADPVFTWAASVFWYMLLFNAINFFDNMDGLAAGTVAVSMFFFTLIAAINGQFLVGAMAALSLGVTLGFWLFNRSPATIFMGDSGSLLLGFLAATVSAKVSYFHWESSLSYFPILLPLFILSMPIFDALTVFCIRCAAKKPFWVGDNNHISHRFVKMGFSRKDAVTVVHALSWIIGLGALPLLWANFITSLVLVLQLFILLFLVLFLQFRFR